MIFKEKWLQKQKKIQRNFKDKNLYLKFYWNNEEPYKSY